MGRLKVLCVAPSREPREEVRTAVRETAAATAAIEQAIAILRKALGEKSSMTAPSREEVSQLATTTVR